MQLSATLIQRVVACLPSHLRDQWMAAQRSGDTTQAVAIAHQALTHAVTGVDPKLTQAVDGVCRDMLDQVPPNPLGHMTTVEEGTLLRSWQGMQGWWPTSAQDVGDRVSHVQQRLVRDTVLAEASGRWNMKMPDPQEYLPGDIAALRTFALRPTLNVVLARAAHMAADQQKLVWTDKLPAMEALQTAVPYYLDAATAVSVMESRPPDAGAWQQLRLPFPRVVVFFSRPLQVPGPTQDLLPDWSVLPPSHPLVGPPVLVSLRDHGAYVDGVVLCADPDGHPLPYVVWLLCSGHGSPMVFPGERVRGFTEGWLAASTLAPLVRNLAAAVAWGDWEQPQPPPPVEGEPGSRSHRKAMSRGAARRAARRGAFDAVRVLDAPRMWATARSSTPSDHPAHRRPPAPHLRRGHWRRVRVGPRSQWSYRTTWIAPTVVNPDGAPLPGLTVYRLPDHDTASTKGTA